jgi:hypothetical protein
LGAAAASDLILTEAGIGTGATDGLTPLTPEFLAGRIGQSPEPAKFPAPWVPGQTAVPPRKPQRPVADWIHG